MRKITSTEKLIEASRMRMLENIVHCLEENNAKNLSDKTFEDAFKMRCGYGALLQYAKEFRDTGILMINTSGDIVYIS